MSCPATSRCASARLQRSALGLDPSVDRPAADDLEEAAEILNTARKVDDPRRRGLQRRARRADRRRRQLKAPIVHAMRGKEFIEYDNPYDVGMTGLLGFSSGYHAMMGCDALLMLGTDFPYQQFYPKDARIIQVDGAANRSAAARRSPSGSSAREGHACRR